MESQKDLRTAQEQSQDDQHQIKRQRTSFKELYRFCEGYEYGLIIVGSIFALIAGCSFPFFAFLWGKILDAFLITDDPQQRVNQAQMYRNIFFYVGVGALISSWIAFACWTILSQRMAVKCRKQYMKSLLRQDVGWFDTINQYELSSQFNNDSIAYQRAIGEKVGSMLNIFAMFACGLAIALAVRWTMTLVIFATLPIIGVVAIIFIYLIHKKDSNLGSLYQKADSCLTQALLSIRTVKSMNGQSYEEQKYASYLDNLKKNVWKYALWAGFGTGLFFFIQYCAFSFGFWYGSHCVAGSYRCPVQTTGAVYTPGEATIVFFALFVGSFNFMQLVPNIQAILNGMYAAKRLYAVIDRKPDIIRNSPQGYKIDLQKRMIGQIQFENVSFSYPSNPNKKILNNLSFKIKPGCMNALAGESGAGKSTVIQLMLRFYDPNEGRIMIDGRDIRDYRLDYLRKQFGYVGQEPALFDGTIRDNLLVGKSDATDQQMIDALKKSSAYQFVKNLPNGLDYDVGYAGSRLSGGQKQRLAITRALLRSPSILFLDEATSALDRRNERLIQNALNTFSRNTTMVVIAHRIKTIMKADKIFVMNKGSLQEQGKFEQLQKFKQLDLKMYQEEDTSEEQKQEQLIDITGSVQQNKVQQQNKRKYKGHIYRRLFKYTQGNRGKLLIAVIASLIAGAVHPSSALFLSNTLKQQFDIYQNSIVDPDLPQVAEDLQRGQDFMLYLFFVAIFIFFPFAIQYALFTKIGQDITEKIRKQVYKKMLKLSVSFYDDKENRGGKAASIVGVDSRKVNSLATSLVSTMLMNFSSIVLGLILALIFEWRLGLIGLIAMPCMVLAGFVSMLFYGGFGDNNQQIYAEASKISEQAILNIRTVYSCSYQVYLYKFYDKILQKPLKGSFAKGTKIGLLYGLSQLILEFTFGILFYFGAVIMRDNQDVQLLNVFYAIMAIAWAGWYAGNNFYFMPDVYAGKKAAANLFGILDLQDQEQAQQRIHSKNIVSQIKGQIQFKNVSFRFPNTIDPILNNLSLTIKQGDKVGFVGPSGSGKSTLIQLLQRFYDPQEGEILIDGVDIKNYSLKNLRQTFGYVSQEPSLFSGTISENIKYNKDYTQAQISAAAKKAKAYDFIMNNEEGFDRDVGVKGSKVSGGQKQRLAISRALIRQPKIFLMDEATSALDMETENEVQKHIDEVMQGKTLISVAHRIQTIKNSTRLYVFMKGQLLEEGSYQQLIEKKRYFYNLEKGLSLLQ